MSDFLVILALYYACDAEAAARALSHAEVMECMTHYQSVKAYFASPGGGSSGGAQAAYESFKDWEHANPDIVADLRRGLRP